MLLHNTVYCVKLGGGHLLRYSNTVVSAGLTKCPHRHYLTKKVMLNNKHSSELAPYRKGGELAWIRYEVIRSLSPYLYRVTRWIAM